MLGAVACESTVGASARERVLVRLRRPLLLRLDRRRGLGVQLASWPPPCFSPDLELLAPWSWTRVASENVVLAVAAEPVLMKLPIDASDPAPSMPLAVRRGHLGDEAVLEALRAEGRRALTSGRDASDDLLRAERALAAPGDVAVAAGPAIGATHGKASVAHDSSSSTRAVMLDRRLRALPRSCSPSSGLYVNWHTAAAAMVATVTHTAQRDDALDVPHVTDNTDTPHVTAWMAHGCSVAAVERRHTTAARHNSRTGKRRRRQRYAGHAGDTFGLVDAAHGCSCRADEIGISRPPRQVA